MIMFHVAYLFLQSEVLICGAALPFEEGSDWPMRGNAPGIQVLSNHLIKSMGEGRDRGNPPESRLIPPS